jgi:hypothetical protein
MGAASLVCEGMKILVAIALALTVAGAPKEAHAGSSFDGLILAEQFYYRLARCETGSNFHHSTPHYTSAFGLTRQNFQRYSNASNGSRYTPRQQAIVVDRLIFTGFTQDNGDHYPAVGPYGFGTVKSNCMGLQRFICKSHKPIVRQWRRNCN